MELEILIRKQGVEELFVTFGEGVKVTSRWALGCVLPLERIYGKFLKD